MEEILEELLRNKSIYGVGARINGSLGLSEWKRSGTQYPNSKAVKIP